MKRFAKMDFAGLTLVVVALLFICVMIIPVVWAVALGFTHSGPFQANATFAGLENYYQLAASSEFWRALGVGLIYAGISTALEMVLGIGIALLLYRHGGSLATSLTLMPYMVPTVTTALIWRWMTDNLNGIFNQMLLASGLVAAPVNFTGSGTLAMILAIVASVWQFTPFVTLVILANLGTISSSIGEAAHVDGANWWQELIHVTLPMLRAPILLVLLLRGVWMFNRFDIIWLLTTGGPLGSTTTLPLYAYIQAFNNNNYGMAGAASTVIFIILLVFGIGYIKVLHPEQEVARG